MSDIRKAIMARLGEFARPGAKAEMANEVSIESVNQLYDRVMPIIHDMNQFVSLSIPRVQSSLKDAAKLANRAAAFGEKILKDRVASPEMLRELDRMVSVVRAGYGYRITQRGASFSRPGAKAKFGGSGIVVKEDAQYIYYYPDEDDRGTFADTDGKGAYTVKSNRTGKPVSAKVYRSWDEANSASNAMNEKLPPLKKRKGFSRAGEKAVFGSKRTTAGALRKQLKAQGITDAADLEWHGISASDPDNTPYWLHEDGSMEKIKASRLGAKAKMSKVSQMLDQLESQARDQKDLAKKNANKIADYVAMHGTRDEFDRFMAIVERLGLNAFERPGAKATHAKLEVEETEEQKAGLKLMAATDQAVSDKIRTLIKEGKPQDQAVAIALDMKRRGEL